MKAKALDVRKMLGLDLTTHEFRLAKARVPLDDKEIAILTRSMLEILREAAAGVQIPQSDLDEGRATKRTLLKARNWKQYLSLRFMSSPPIRDHQLRKFMRQ